MAESSGLTNPEPWLQQWADAQRQTPAPANPRIQHMIHILLENQQKICDHATGTFELHFHHSKVTARLIAHVYPPS